MSAIATFRTNISALLYDVSNVIFTTAEIDQALRWALSEYSLKRPMIKTYDYTVIGTTRVHTMPADFVTRHVTNVQLWDADPDKYMDILFHAFLIDEQWTIQTRYEMKDGDVLQISYSAVHQVDGLDAAAGTTIPAADEPMLQIGAAGHAAQMRAVGTVESINMNANVVTNYRLLAADYLARFTAALFAEPGIRVALPDFPDTSMRF